MVRLNTLCLCLHNFHLVPPKLLVLQSPTPGKSPPSQPFHLQEPTYLNVAQECLHPLQPAPSKMRSFVCAKVFRRLKLQSTITQIQKSLSQVKTSINLCSNSKSLLQGRDCRPPGHRAPDHCARTQLELAADEVTISTS